MTSEHPRIRDVYRDYQRGRIPFEQVVTAADTILERYARVAASRSPKPVDQEQRPTRHD